MIKHAFTLILTLIFSFFSSNLWSYEEYFVHNGSTLQGKVTLAGNIPEPRLYHLVLFPNMDLCAEVDTDDDMNRFLTDFEVSEDRGLKDTVISLEYVEGGVPFHKGPIEIRAENCRFYPNVNIVRQESEQDYEEIYIDNRDPVIHNSQVYQSEQGKIILNIPVPAEEISKGIIRFRKNFRIFQMICGMHEFMQTWGYRVQNPYYFVTGKDGSYKIENIPPGDYVVNAWHHHMNIQSRVIHVAENSTINLDFVFNGDEVVRPQYETIASGRIKKEAFKSRAEVLSN